MGVASSEQICLFGCQIFDVSSRSTGVASLEKIDDWPLRSKLDPEIYGSPESLITKKLVEQEIGGFMNLEESKKYLERYISVLGNNTYSNGLQPFSDSSSHKWHIKDCGTFTVAYRQKASNSICPPVFMLNHLLTELLLCESNGNAVWDSLCGDPRF
ncbi:hypothetical protein RJ640_028920 [Escallonia rubra]|uniref:Lipoxygenase domain-containing protein n=1 Tax=Escallonia rubra TaxID=112253 RepID=A0AA88UAM5_9ASTE|nr:hypothetical protein RJ640_028920 [Escallonia rubra]